MKETDKIQILVNNAKKGDDTSFVELINFYKENLYKMAFIYVKNEQDALNIVSDTVYKAYMNISKLRESQYFSSWIIKILINLSINKLKSNKNIDSAVNQNLSQNISKIQKDKNISITVDNVITDDKDIFILYTLNGATAGEDIKNLLLEKFSISDNNGKTLLSSNDFRSQILPPKLNNKNEDSLSLSNTNYKCIISSLGNSIENYSKNKKTFGSIELISIKDMKIPDEINLMVSGITEVYNMSYSKETYNNFISKFNREPKNISGNWNFEIKLDKNLKSQKPEEYNNIPFLINNTDFTFKSVKIYPTHTEIRIQLGKNSIDKSQCSSIGRIIGGDTSKLPYLTDEKGNKYNISGNALVSMDSENCVNLSFESPYFNKTNKLYLVINQLNYSNGEPYTNIETTKVKIK